MPEASLEHHDAAGVRRPQTRRAGRICANSFAQSLGQPDLRFELDLDANAPRQNGSIYPGRALGQAQLRHAATVDGVYLAGDEGRLVRCEKRH